MRFNKAECKVEAALVSVQGGEGGMESGPAEKDPRGTGGHTIGHERPCAAATQRANGTPGSAKGSKRLREGTLPLTLLS